MFSGQPPGVCVILLRSYRFLVAKGFVYSTPALTEIVCFVISRLSSEARNSARLAISSG